MFDYETTENNTALQVLKTWAIVLTVSAAVIGFVFLSIQIPVMFGLSYEIATVSFMILISTLLVALMFAPGSDE
jgi:hypothetical protein